MEDIFTVPPIGDPSESPTISISSLAVDEGTDYKYLSLLLIPLAIPLVICAFVRRCRV